MWRDSMPKAAAGLTIGEEFWGMSWFSHEDNDDVAARPCAPPGRDKVWIAVAGGVEKAPGDVPGIAMQPDRDGLELQAATTPSKALHLWFVSRTYVAGYFSANRSCGRNPTFACSRLSLEAPCVDRDGCLAAPSLFGHRPTAAFRAPASGYSSPGWPLSARRPSRPLGPEDVPG